ncbi:polysaccharide biosynthesis/export family protein [Limnoglobus roseus]|uniref:Polysaccharide biosynthesis/export protein n=1 Tax=Limnoglobus roseus TaxID=2598579 RepID=A0A5C1A9X9_9BACT|nr:polysaccharide biosynthesis/export family protein [Limnoglobus roseus]QEL15540.1 polysaccharide biosynthesis/export protein [Limnoglobus roseus]
MRTGFSTIRLSLICLAVMLVAASTGCMSPQKKTVPPIVELPRELKKTTQPAYTIEPPDILQIDLINAVPKQPYKLKTLDVLAIKVRETPPDNPILGLYPIEPDGRVNLGAFYGTIAVAGLSAEDAKKAVAKHLEKFLKVPEVEVTLAQTRGMQQVRGPHLVRPDGTISLGTYGGVWVVGLTLAEAKAKIEEHLSIAFETPEISLDVTGYNSKVYYLIYDGGGAGQSVLRLPVTGNETVLDAVSQAAGLQTVSDKRHIWVARPSEDHCHCQNLPVDWKAITECGDVRTNYQLMPGDRIFVNSYKATRIETVLNRVLGPVERAFGFTLLGTGLVRTLGNQSLNGNGNGFNNGVVQ